MRLLMIADTHVPARARDLPDELWAAVDAADLVIHAGDWVDVRLLDALTARSAALLGVYGNNDGPALRARLPEVAWLTIQGVRLAVVHETGPAAPHRPAAPAGGHVPHRRHPGRRAGRRRAARLAAALNRSPRPLTG